MRDSRTIEEAILVTSAVPCFAVVDDIASMVVDVECISKVACAVAEPRGVIDAVVVAPAVKSVAVVIGFASVLVGIQAVCIITRAMI